MVWALVSIAKDYLNVFFNSILAQYVENMDTSQISYGISQGLIELRNLRVRKGALDKFKLPVDVVEGYLGVFYMKTNWLTLGREPVQIFIEDLHLLVASSAHSESTVEEDEERAQRAKMERLENAELLHFPQDEKGDPIGQQGILQQIYAKVLNNVQINVKNIHIRYEDAQSVPGHPFAAGVTLSNFSAVTTDECWKLATVEGAAKVIHKLTTLESLSVYFDTDAQSLTGLPFDKFKSTLAGMISRENHFPHHQYILKPVSGNGKITMNRARTKNLPRYGVQLDFKEIGFGLDSDQYRDIISVLDMFHFNARREQYKRFRPSEDELKKNKARAMLHFAGNAILDEVHERAKQWTWSYVKRRGDNRRKYFALYKQKITASLVQPEDQQAFAELERDLSYSLIRLYRSLVRAEMKSDLRAKRKEEEERERRKKEQQQSSSWVGWLWGSGSAATSDSDTVTEGGMTAQQRKELYEILDYDEKAAIAEAFEASSDTEILHVTAKLERGSFALLSGPGNHSRELLSMVFDKPQSVLIKRPENFEVSLTLADFGVFDGVTPGSLYKQIVHVKDREMQTMVIKPSDAKGVKGTEPFFSLKFEHKPLDKRADSALTIFMRSMEIIYHRGYVEAVYAFFKPPESQLQSVEALLSVASQTLEGLRRETRLGLEFALENHKTVDLRLNMHAPIIIIPESVHIANCGTLVLDAGQIAIESKLADKDALQEVYDKRHSVYTDEDFDKLEALMYDIFTVKLKDAQFVLGPSLEACRSALNAVNTDSNLHLLERINIDLTAHNSIVPTARNLTRFKVQARLSSMHVNFSDSKYKVLMRLIDIAIPQFNGGSDNVVASNNQSYPNQFALTSGIFAQEQPDYGEVVGQYGANSTPPQSEGTDEKQLQFQLNFEVEKLQATLSKSTSAETEKILGQAALEQFALAVAVAQYDMKVNVALGSITMDLQHEDKELQPIITTVSDAAETPNLMQIVYTRVQPQHPEFSTTYEGVGQDVDIRLSTIVMKTDPEDLVSLYDFIMKTFVQSSDAQTIGATVVLPENTTIRGDEVLQQPTSSSRNTDVLRVHLSLASVRIVLEEASSSFATLDLPTADLSMILKGGATRLTARLGNLLYVDNASTLGENNNEILSFKGGEFMDLQYESFDTTLPEHTGAQPSVTVKAGSLHVVFLERPLHATYTYLAKLARLKGLYDAASEAAVQKASEIVRLKFDIAVKSPVLVIPSGTGDCTCSYTMKLGEITASNSFTQTSQKIQASLNGLQLSSTMALPDGTSSLKIIDDVSILADVVQADSTGNDGSPTTQVDVTLPDVRMHLVEMQYHDSFKILRALTRVLSLSAEQQLGHDPSDRPQLPTQDQDHERLSVDLNPELSLNKQLETSGSNLGQQIALKLSVTMTVVRLYLYDSITLKQTDLKGFGIARFALNNVSFSLTRLVDEAMQLECSVHSFTVTNTKQGSSRFREIIPAARHGRNQLMLLYSVTGGSSPVSELIANIDSPQVIFSLEPVFAISDFFLGAFGEEAPQADGTTKNDAPNGPAARDEGSIHIRLGLHNVSVVVLESDVDPHSQAVELSMKQCTFSQQGVSALIVDRLCISLIQMNKPSERAHLLDDFALSCTLESRNSLSHSTTSIELNCKRIVLRASYRDITLTMSIINKALELASKTTSRVAVKPGEDTEDTSTTAVIGNVTRNTGYIQSVTSGAVIISKEQLTATFDGFDLILINDVHETPMFYFETKAFGVDVKDWSSQLRARSTLSVGLNYWNVKNSHWEPFIDPWELYVKAGRDSPVGSINVGAASHELLDINISTNFIEQLLMAASQWSKEKESVLGKARGSYAPYLVQNRTGKSIILWSGNSTIFNTEDQALRVANGKTADWRFDDWQTTRQRIQRTNSGTISLRLQETSWRDLCDIPVDEEGKFSFTLQGPDGQVTDKLMCEVTLRENVKVVTFRSTLVVVNKTLYPIEVMIVGNDGHHVFGIEKIAPENDYPIPLDATTSNGIRLQPDQGFGYKWSSPIRWDDVLNSRNRSAFTIRCTHASDREAPFRFLVWPEARHESNHPDYVITLRAPIELENLLPYDIEYTLYDRDSQNTWSSYLRKGGIMPAHSVELAHMVLLSITIQDTSLSASEFAIINSDGKSDFDPENKLTLTDNLKRQLDLRINYVRYPNSGGAFKVQIYSPYVVLNKTGLPFAVRSVRTVSFGKGAESDLAGVDQGDETAQRKPFLLSHQQSKGHEFQFKVGPSVWSQPINFEPPSAELCTIAPWLGHKSEALVGVSWSEGSGKFKLSKVIILAPRFIVYNKTDKSVKFRQYKSHHDITGGVPEVLPGEKKPVVHFHPTDERLLTFAYTGLDARWSSPVNIEDIGTIHLRMAYPGSRTGEDHLIAVEVLIQNATIFVYLTSHKGDWPFLIRNDSGYHIKLGQTDQIREQPDPYRGYLLAPRTELAYAWDFPAAKEKRIHITCEGKSRNIDIMEIGALPPLKIAHGVGALSLDLKALGSSQLLTISNYREDRSVYKPRRQDTLRGTNTVIVDFEAIEEGHEPLLVVKLDLEGIGISMMNKRLVEVVYFTLSRLNIEYTNSPISQSITVSCGVLQVDNQLQDAHFPVLLQPSPIARDARNLGALPTLQASAIILNDNAHGVFFVKYASVLLQAITIQIDEAFLYAFLDLTDVSASWNTTSESDILIPQPDGIPEPTRHHDGQDVYFEILELQPVLVSVSFVRNLSTTNSTTGSSNTRNPLAVALDILTMALGNLGDARLQFNALGLKDARLALPDLQGRIFYHYRQEVLRQLYRVLGSADFLGNPVGLFTNVTSGVADIFYEPWRGVVMHGNREIGIGIAKGAASFLKKTVFGVSDSVTKVTSSIGKGLSAATLDADFQNKRHIAQRRNKPRHAFVGVKAGAEAFANSVASGVEGVLLKPIEGAEAEGPIGFFKGVGKGIVGAVTKPVVGVFDLASNVSEGIRNTTTVFDTPQRDRARKPRVVPFDGVLKPYDRRGALGQYYLRDLDEGAFRGEFYVAHIDSPSSDNIVLLTDSRLLSFRSRKLRLEWDLPLRAIHHVTVQDDGIKFYTKSEHETEHFVHISEEATLTWFFDEISSIVKRYNARRKLGSAGRTQR